MRADPLTYTLATGGTGTTDPKLIPGGIYQWSASGQFDTVHAHLSILLPNGTWADVANPLGHLHVTSLPVSSSPVYLPAGSVRMTIDRGQIGEGDGSTVAFAYAGSVVYRQDWQGDQLMYDTARTNLALQSQTIGTSWSAVQSTVVANQIAAPDGTTTVDFLRESNANAAHSLALAFTGTDNADYVLSAWVKGSGRDVTMYIRDKANQYRGLVVDLTTGTATASNTPLDYGAIPYPNNMWRIWCKVNAVTGGTGPAMYFYITRNGAQSYLGDGSSGIYIWGIDLKQASVLSSYIGPTTTVAVTATDVSFGGGNVTFSTAPLDGAIISGEGAVSDLNAYLCGLG